MFDSTEFSLELLLSAISNFAAKETEKFCRCAFFKRYFFPFALQAYRFLGKPLRSAAANQ